MSNDINIGDSSEVGRDVVGGDKNVYNIRQPHQGKTMQDRAPEEYHHDQLQREISDIRTTLATLVTAISGDRLSYNSEGLTSIVRRLENSVTKMQGIVNTMQTNIEARLATVESRVELVEHKIVVSQGGGVAVAVLLLFLVFFMLRSLAG